jgi:hypothetical protein
MANLAFTVAANAQPAWVGKFKLPYEVHWNHAVLPAGDYTISMDSKSAPALVRSTNGSRSIYTGVPTIATSEKGSASLLITVGDGQHTVRSMNSPLLGVPLVFQAIPRSEREALTNTSQLESVPVMVTKK